MELKGFLSKIKKRKDGCWEWQGFIDKGGYGRCDFNYKGERVQLAHRVGYLLSKGDIPKELELDHLCRNRECVNPNHLEAVSRRENQVRGISFSAVNAKKTHCIHGHEFIPENTIIHNKGRRECRKCAYKRRDIWESKHPNYHHNYYLDNNSNI